MIRRQIQTGHPTNCPALRKYEYYAMLAEKGAHPYSDRNIELGSVESTRVCTLAITDPGDSRIVRSLQEKTSEKSIIKIFLLTKLAKACLQKRKK